MWPRCAEEGDRFEDMKSTLDGTLAVRMLGWTSVARSIVFCFAVTYMAVTAHAFTASDADAIFDAHTKAFYKEKDGRGWYAKTTEGGKADYWTWAEQLEMVMDVYERTKNPQQLGMFTNLFRGFLETHGTNWGRNSYNDDIMWMVIACTRA